MLRKNNMRQNRNSADRPTGGVKPALQTGPSQAGRTAPPEADGSPEQGSWIYQADRKDLISIIKRLPAGVAVLGSPFGNALHINDEIIATLGHSLCETPSTRDLHKKIIPAARDRREANKIWKEVVKAGGGILPESHTYLCKDGKIRSFEHRSIVLRKNLIVNMWIDVTQQVAAETELRESEARFRSFFEKSTDPFLLLDGDRVVNCNVAAQGLFRSSDKDHLMGKTMEELSPMCQTNDRPTSSMAGTLLKSAFRRGNLRTEWAVRTADGRDVPVELSTATIVLKGKTFLFMTLRDITPWKEAQTVLLHSKADLEDRVRERTTELTAANRRLLKEIEIRKTAERNMRGSREELRNLSEHLQNIREEERTRIAREIHDQLGQSLSAVTIDLTWLRERLPKRDSALKERVLSIERQISGTMESVREICRELRPPVFDDFGLPTAIKWYLRQFQNKTGIVCTAAIDEELPVHDKAITMVIFRIFQEAMTNILRHSEATRVQVTLKNSARSILLEVKDNGKGITTDQTANPMSLGILGIRERVRFWGGKSSFLGSPGKGTTVTVSIPINLKRTSPREGLERSAKTPAAKTRKET
jgi:PAS domain S-box-containing protein